MELEGGIKVIHLKTKLQKRNPAYEDTVTLVKRQFWLSFLTPDFRGSIPKLKYFQVPRTNFISIETKLIPSRNHDPQVNQYPRPHIFPTRINAFTPTLLN